MYQPTAFAVQDLDRIRAILLRAPLAQIVVSSEDTFLATPAPLLLDSSGTKLIGHLAKPNDVGHHAVASADGVPCIAIFTGVDGYVSPSAYPSKVEHGKVVPTWNYISVQARGTLTIHDDPTWVGQLVRSLTEWHEAQFETPWTVDDAPPEFIETQLKAIVGIEIQITSLEGKWKLSQNRPESDIAGVISGLDQRGPLTNEIKVAQAVAAASGVLTPT